MTWNTGDVVTAADMNALATLAGAETLTNKTIDLTDNAVTGTVAEFNAAISDGDIATLAGAETLTNKTIDLTDNTVTGTVAEFNTSLSDGDFATLAGAETLTSKTVTSLAFDASTHAVATGGMVAWHNQADQTTNYERARLYWSSNVFTLGSDAGGTGTARPIQLLASGNKTLTIGVAPSAAWFDFSAQTGTAQPMVRVSGQQSQSSSLATGLQISPSINQSGTAGYTMLLINPTQSATGSGAKLLIDAQVASVSKFKVDNAGLTEIASTGGFHLYNTSDQTTNYERGRALWSGNVFTLTVDKGGTGTSRNLALSNKGTLTMQSASQSAVIGTIGMADSTATAGAATVAITGTGSASSGSQYGLSVSPTYAQTSTAGYTVLLLNSTETSTGSGTKRLVDAQMNSASRFTVDNAGVVTISGTTASLRAGTGTPEGNVTANVGSIYLRTDGSTSTTLYVKTSGSGNTGWTAK